jgi:hypothetical protein
VGKGKGQDGTNAYVVEIDAITLVVGENKNISLQ